jgi:quinol monooxygenase YgiN
MPLPVWSILKSKEEAMTVRIYVRHDVTDYAAWRKAYDAFDAKRRKMGVTGQAVYRSIDDANDVTVTHDFTNAEKAKAFASSPDLKAAMEKAGVKGTPQIWFTIRSRATKR